MIAKITEQISTGPFCDAASYLESAEWRCAEVIDVRTLLDGEGNTADELARLLNVCAEIVRNGGKIVVCCDYGRSRSNAIAAGVIALTSGCNFRSALRQVTHINDQAEIDLGIAVAIERVISVEQHVQSVRENVLVIGDAAIAKSALKSLGSNGFITSALDQNSANQAVIYAAIRDCAADTVVAAFQPSDFNSPSRVTSKITFVMNLIRVCRESGAHLVFCGSSSVYDHYVTTNMIACESTPFYARSNYGLASVACENLIQQACAGNEFKVTVLRFSRILGEGAGQMSMPVRFARMLRSGKSITTHLCHNGRPAMDWIDCNDAGDAIVEAVRRRRFGHFNIGSGILTETRQFADLIAQEMGVKNCHVEVRVDRWASNISFDAAKAKRQLNWIPRTGITEGIKRIIETEIR